MKKTLLTRHQFAAALLFLFFIIECLNVSGQPSSRWIRPSGRTAPSMWGIRGGIVFTLWPYNVETTTNTFGGGPRGLIRVGYEFRGAVHLINFLAVEPVVGGRMEFSEISPSQVDQKWGKLMWASETEEQKTFEPYAATPGLIEYPDPTNKSIESLSIFVFMEKFANGAHPYLKLTIRSDKPDELGVQVFEQKGSAAMERCVITATMGNYGRLRKIYLKDAVLNSKEVYSDYDDVHFVEKDSYSHNRFNKDRNGDLIVAAETDESFSQLASWPQEERYLSRVSWRYRPAYKLTQYWRKEAADIHPSLVLRVNGRKYYWAGGTREKSQYVPIPNGTAFENFELREKFVNGQKFFLGLTRKSPQSLLE